MNYRLSFMLPNIRKPYSDLLAELKSGLELIYGKCLKQLFVYGSYARGEEDEESDLDILVVLGDFERYVQEVDRTGPLTSDLLLKYGISICTVFVRESEWLRDETPFLVNIRDEAIRV